MCNYNSTASSTKLQKHTLFISKMRSHPYCSQTKIQRLLTTTYHCNKPYTEIKSDLHSFKTFIQHFLLQHTQNNTHFLRILVDLNTSHFWTCPSESYRMFLDFWPWFSIDCHISEVQSIHITNWIWSFLAQWIIVEFDYSWNWSWTKMVWTFDSPLK